MSQHIFFCLVFVLSIISCEEYKYELYDQTCPMKDSTKEICFSQKTDDENMECCFAVSTEDNDHNFCFSMTNEPLTKAYVETKGNLFSYQIKVECPSDAKTPEVSDEEENTDVKETEETQNNSASYLSPVVLIVFVLFCL